MKFISSNLYSCIGFCALSILLFVAEANAQDEGNNVPGQWVLNNSNNQDQGELADEELVADAEEELLQERDNKLSVTTLPPPELSVTAEHPQEGDSQNDVDEIIESEAIVDAEETDGEINLEIDDFDNGEYADEEQEPLDIEQLVEESKVMPGKQGTTIHDLQLRNDLDEAFSKISQLLETEDSFSESLGEHYFAYGNLLFRAGQFKEALQAYTDALHIQKVNNGIYSLEQRPALREIFYTHQALGSLEDSENALSRILWIEGQGGHRKDDFTYRLLLTVGNNFIDEFLRLPVPGAVGLEHLQKAKRYLQIALIRHDDEPLGERRLPYGELALVNLLENSLMDKLNGTLSIERSRLNHRDSRDLSHGKVREMKRRQEFNYLSNAYPRGQRILREYLNKAIASDQTSEIATAFLNLGDLSLMFSMISDAAGHYRSAWNEAQKLPEGHELRESFKQPVQLPAFNYAQPRSYVGKRWHSRAIPLTFEVNKYGRASRILPIDRENEHFKFYSRAKRALKKLSFRPVILDGERSEGTVVGHTIPIRVSESEVITEEES